MSYLMCGLLLTLPPLEAEPLHRKHDFARPDRGGLEAPDDVARLHSIHLAVGHIAQHRDAARGIPPVVVDAHQPQVRQQRPDVARDRKSTRLNSSHLVISYAVFCLKKKNKSSHHTIT